MAATQDPIAVTDAECCSVARRAARPRTTPSELAQAFAALGDPVRLRLFSLIAAAGEVLLVRPGRADRQEPADGQPPHQGARRRRADHRREARPVGELVGRPGAGGSGPRRARAVAADGSGT